MCTVVHKNVISSVPYVVHVLLQFIEAFGSRVNKCLERNHINLVCQNQTIQYTPI